MVKRLQDWVTIQAEQRPDAVAVAFNPPLPAPSSQAVNPDSERSPCRSRRGERADINMSLSTRVEESPPVKAGFFKMTYAELEAGSNRLARMLKEEGCKKGDRVCVLMPKSPMAIVCILGIYKADCVFVPLDPSSPAVRLSKIVESCGNRWILAAGPVTPLLAELLDEERCRAPISIGWMDRERMKEPDRQPAFSLTDLETYPTAPPEYRTSLQDPAHLLFTSGSTGVPKGVIITHANVIHFIKWAKNYFELDGSDRVSGHSPLHFDLSTFDIFGAFSVGAQLHLVPPELNVLPHKLADFIRTAELTQWFSVPSILNYLAKFDVVTFNDFPALRRLLWCGEVFPTPALIYWMKRLPSVTFTNLYGPTETTIASSFYTVPACPENERAAVPIGAACAGEELLVLNEALQPVPPGELGDLYIRGAGLSPGYWNDPEKTRAAFLPNPQSPDPSDRIYKTGDRAKIGEDGLVYFGGRVDAQIKSRGYRIELGEIETALNAVNGLQECAVVAVPADGFEGTAIGCAFVPFPGRDVTPMTLRKELSRLLPSYMLPTRWMAFNRLPKNANGKVDRRRLREALQDEDSRHHATETH